MIKKLYPYYMSAKLQKNRVFVLFIESFICYFAQKALKEHLKCYFMLLLYSV